MIFIVFGTRFARANIIPNRMAQHLLMLIRRKSLPRKGLRQIRGRSPFLWGVIPYLFGMDEHPFTCTVGYRHDPVLSTTIFPHDTIDDADMDTTLRVNHVAILTFSHSDQNLVEAIHFLFLWW